MYVLWDIDLIQTCCYDYVFFISLLFCFLLFFNFLNANLYECKEIGNCGLLFVIPFMPLDTAVHLLIYLFVLVFIKCAVYFVSCFFLQEKIPEQSYFFLIVIIITISI